MKNKQLTLFLISFLATIAVAAGLIFLISRLEIPQFGQLTFGQNNNVVPFHTHFGLDPAVPNLVVNSQRLREGIAPIVKYRGGVPHVYLPASFLQADIDPFLFWDEGAGVFFASTRYDMLEFVPGSASVLINGQSRPLATPIKRVQGEVFLPAALVESMYPLVVEYSAEYNMVVISHALQAQTTGTVSVNNANVRYRPEGRASITVRLRRGDTVVIFPSYTDSDFVRVRTPQGLLGYMLAENIDDKVTSYGIDISRRTLFLPDWIDNTTPRPPRWDGGKINLVWEQSTNQDANRNRMQMPLHSSVTVVSPTWFGLDQHNLNISSAASRAYVDWAHNQGVYVWPKVFDTNRASATAILTNRDARRTVINQLVTYVERYNLDGININFEHLDYPLGPYKIQFLREFGIAMQDKDIVLSAAVFVPMDWSRFYRRDLIGLTLDFVMVMTYDEHWARSPVSGPVASLSWVQGAIINMLREVPREQLLMGLPFYNRVWREVVGQDGPPTQTARGMDATRTFFEENGVQWVWDSSIGSYYGYFVTDEDGVTVRYRVWLEDVNSIAAKMQIYVVYDLAGVAGWRRGFENEGIWDLLGIHFGVH